MCFPSQWGGVLFGPKGDSFSWRDKLNVPRDWKRAENPEAGPCGVKTGSESLSHSGCFLLFVRTGTWFHPVPGGYLSLIGIVPQRKHREHRKTYLRQPASLHCSRGIRHSQHLWSLRIRLTQAQRTRSIDEVTHGHNRHSIGSCLFYLRLEF